MNAFPNSINSKKLLDKKYIHILNRIEYRVQLGFVVAVVVVVVVGGGGGGGGVCVCVCVCVYVCVCMCVCV